MKKVITILLLIACHQISLKSQDILFEKTYGDDRLTRFLCIDEMQTGHYIAVGHATFNSTNSVGSYITKTNIDGDTLWTKKTTQSGTASARCVLALPDNNFVTAGFVPDDQISNTLAHFAKYDADGNLLWEHIYDENIYRFQNVIQTQDDGFVLTGVYKDSLIELANYVLKTDADGNEIWSYLIDTPDNGLNSQVDLLETQDGNLIFAGTIQEFPNQGGFLIKLNSLGELIWKKNYIDGHNLYSIIQSSDNQYLICGRSHMYDAFLMKVDQNGEKIWEKTYGIPENFAINYDLIQTPNGEIYTCGYTVEESSTKAHLIKTDATGALLWESFYGGEYSDQFFKMILTSDLKLVLAGHINSIFNTVITNGYLVKIHDGISTSTTDKINNSNQLRIVPNPSNGNISIIYDQESYQVQNVEIYNIEGKNISATYDLQIDQIEIANLKKGIYYAKIYTNHKPTWTQLFIVL